MLEHGFQRVGLSEADLDFVVREAAPDAANAERLKGLIREDEAFRRAMVGDERVFARVMTDEEIFVRISPALYFEVLLRRALVELEQAVYTLEYDRAGAIPVFDTSAIVELLARRGVVGYLADMLSSFTRVRVSVTAVRVRRGIWRRVRTSDMDIDSLVRLCSAAEPEQRFAFYKRIADVCLFVSGLFPHSARGHQRSFTPRVLGPTPPARARRSLEEYVQEGRRFYELAAEHPAARALELTGVLGLLGENFTTATKPLRFIASHYLHSKGRQLFAPQSA